MARGTLAGSEGVVRFADFKLDRVRRTLSSHNVRLKLQPQPLRILELLIDKAPATVSREEVRREVWGDDVNIDVEQNLNYCIRQIRLALGDDPATPRFVETVPRQGYRFIGAVIGEAEAPAVQLPPRRSFGFPKWWLAGAAIFATGLLLIAAMRWAARPKGGNDSPLVYVTTYPGDETDPSFSPGGNQVAFSWGGKNNDNRDIYVLPIGGQNPLRLTQDPADDDSPAWSPDGRSIAFIRRTGAQSANIMLIPALGGPERLLRTIRLAASFTFIEQRKIAWSPDGEWLVFTDQLSSGNHALFLLSLKTGAVRPVFPRHPAWMEETAPAFSRDGRWLAFARFSNVSESKLLIQRMSLGMGPEGEPIQVPDAGLIPHSPAWDTNGNRLLFLDRFTVKQFEMGRSTKEVYGGDARLLGLSVSNSRLIAVRNPFDFYIHTIPLRPGGLSAAGPDALLIHSAMINEQPRFSPDGKQLAFVSHRTNNSELWLADAVGGNEKRLTDLDAHIMGFPRWSPDGRHIAFHARLPSIAQIFIVDVAGGVARQITTEAWSSGTPSWSDDGKTLYVSKMIPGRGLVYKVPAGGGKEEPAFEGEGAFPVPVPGRNLLLYAKINKFGIFSRALEQGSASNVEEQLVDDYLPPNGGIYPFEDGIYYIGYTSAGIARAFRFYSFATKKSVDVAPAPAKIGLGLSISPDRRRLAYCAQVEGNSDLIMVDLK